MKVVPGHVERLRLAFLESAFSYRALLSGLYAATFCIRASFGIATVLLSIYLPVGDALFGLVIAVTPLAEIVAVPFVGVANDRYGRRHMLMAGLAVAALSLAARVATRDLVPHLFFNVLHGVSAALILVTSLALLADYAAAETRGREMGIFDFVSLFGWMAGFMLGLVFKDLAADQLWIGFAFAALVALAGIAAAWPGVREPAGAQSMKVAADMRDIVGVALQPRVALVLAPWLIVFIFIGSFSSFLERLSTAVGLSGLEAALALAVITVVLLAANVGYGRLSDLYGRGPFILLGAWGFFAFTTAIAFLVLRAGVEASGGEFRAAIAGQLPLFGPFLALSFIAMLAFGPAALAALADEAQRGPSGVTMSLYSLVVGLGFVLGPIITGTVSQFSGSGGVAVLLFVEGVGLVLLVSLRNHLHALGRA